MSRLGGSESIVVAPMNNVYTALVGVCVVLEILGLIALFVTHQNVFGVGLFS